ncbi:MAG: hypothetical protein EZS28_000662 [Streblomastix strix]|uniref:Uncharacterized protein n=1 Tax=Streblomastix strix TaxID=222440 RepID=A0A5J4XA70_9EUKA|nr:MAG: hypothetical protein EZS28_000662 [Streblomastix strix]
MLRQHAIQIFRKCQSIDRSTNNTNPSSLYGRSGAVLINMAIGQNTAKVSNQVFDKSVTFVHCVFQENVGAFGGAIAFGSLTSSYTQSPLPTLQPFVTFDTCMFLHNQAVAFASSKGNDILFLDKRISELILPSSANGNALNTPKESIATKYENDIPSNSQLLFPSGFHLCSSNSNAPLIAILGQPGAGVIYDTIIFTRINTQLIDLIQNNAFEALINNWTQLGYAVNTTLDLDKGLFYENSLNLEDIAYSYNIQRLRIHYIG